MWQNQLVVLPLLYSYRSVIGLGGVKDRSSRQIIAKQF